MSWEVVNEPSEERSEHTVRIPRRPRHRGSDPSPSQHWWSTGRTPSSRRSVPADDTVTRRVVSPISGQVLFPGTGSVRAVVGPWTVVSPDHPRQWSRSPGDTDDPPTTRLRTPAHPHDSKFGDPSRTESAQAAPTPPTVSRAVVFPPDSHPGERGWAAYRAHTTILTGRQFLVWTRDRTTLLQTLLFPALSMIMFKVVLGDAIGKATGQNSAFGTVPLVVLVGAMFGSLAGGVRLMSERKTGLLTRLYVMPVHRGADLSARLIAELARIMLGTIILLLLGMFIGWRFNQGVLPAVAIFGVALLFGAAFSTVVLALALTSSNIPLVPILSLVSSLVMFFNSGFSPVSAYPGFLQPIVANQPMTCAIDAMRALAVGGPVAESFTKTLLWAVGILALFTYPALRGYRRAASPS